MTALASPMRRESRLFEQIVFLDGVTGTGKTMMAPILATLARVEVQRIEHVYEHTCGLNYLGGLSDEGAIVMLRMYADLGLYNSMIGRESNFRWKDLSGVLSNPGGFRYLRRLFMPDGDAVVDRIRSERPIPHVVSHQMLSIGRLLFQAYGSGLTVVEMVRHPLHLLRHWLSYLPRHGVDARDFTLWIGSRAGALPWFAKGREEQYLAGTEMDRVVLSLECLTDLVKTTMDGLSPDQRAQILIVPFERFVTAPATFLSELAARLSTVTTAKTTKELKRQRVPRRISTDGRDLPIYRRYDWRPPSPSTSEAGELRQAWDFAETHASPSMLERLEYLCRSYESGYLGASDHGALAPQSRHRVSAT